MQSHKSLSLLKFTACGYLSALNRVRYEVILQRRFMKFHYTMLFNLKGKTHETNLPLLLIMELEMAGFPAAAATKAHTVICRFGPPCPPQLSSWVPSVLLYVL